MCSKPLSVLSRPTFNLQKVLLKLGFANKQTARESCELKQCELCCGLSFEHQKWRCAFLLSFRSFCKQHYISCGPRRKKLGCRFSYLAISPSDKNNMKICHRSPDNWQFEWARTANYTLFAMYVYKAGTEVQRQDARVKISMSHFAVSCRGSTSFCEREFAGASLLRHILVLPPAHTHPLGGARTKWYICGTSQQFAKSQKSQSVRFVWRMGITSPRTTTHQSKYLLGDVSARSHFRA